MKCVRCGAEVLSNDKRRQYCDTCRVLNKRATEVRSQRKHRHPDWTEEDWRLSRERRQARRDVPGYADARRMLKSTPAYQERMQEKKRKYMRVYQRRLRGQVVCFWCEQIIPEETIKAHHSKELPKFHNRECSLAYRRYFGFYQKMSIAGNEAQARYKAQIGQIPQYEKRRDAVSQSNKEHPRRAKVPDPWMRANDEQDEQWIEFLSASE